MNPAPVSRIDHIAVTAPSLALGAAWLEQVLGVAPPVAELARKVEEYAKGMIGPGTLFEEFGFHYYGPIDGHDLDALIPTLQNLRKLKGPQFLHVITRKGQGYKLAEADPVLYHGVSKFDHTAGIQAGKSGGKLTYTQVFGDWLCDAARADGRVVAITPAMREGSGLVRFSQEFPSRYFDVAIAEQHAVTFAAGIACEGGKPVVAIYSTFLQRAYDQLIHDVALQNLDVTFAVDRAGQVGADGATHAGSFDLSYARALPNMVVMAPADERECRLMLQSALEYPGPALVRYPRGSGPGTPPAEGLETLPIGEGVQLRSGSRVAILAFGSMLARALTVADSLDATVANMRFVKPLDAALVERLACNHELLVTIEENVVQGGAGSAVNELLVRRQNPVRVLNLGLPDRFIEHASSDQQLQQAGLDVDAILRSINQALDGESMGEFN